jgi:hypothetical protein
LTEDIKQTDPPELSEQLVWDIVQFAQAQGYLYPSTWTPSTVNARMLDITLMNQANNGITEEKVAKALSNPKNSEKELLAISESFEITSMPYKKMLEYLSNLPSWGMSYYCQNISDIKEYKSSAYKKDLDIFREFTYKFDYKKEFGTILKELFRSETYYGILRDESSSKYVMQQLPPDKCRITGKWDYGWLFTFDYTWFMNSGVDLDMFPEICKKTYNKLFLKSGQNKYNPSLPIGSRSESTFVLEADCDPTDGFWAWKLQSDQNVRLPYFTPLFPDLAMQPLIRGLQRSSYMAAAAKLVFGSVPMLDQKASVKDAISINPQLLGQFLQMVKQAVNNEAVKVASAPLTDMKAMEFKSDNEIYSSYNRTTSGMAGNSNILFPSEGKQNQVETYFSADIDTMVSTSIYPWFNNFMEYQVNKRTKKYKFGIQFEGTNFYIDKERRLERQTGLMGLGFFNPVKLASALDENPFIMQAQLAEARANGSIDDLTPVISSAQMSGNTQKTGRPSKSDSELSDSGAETRDRGSNIGK